MTVEWNEIRAFVAMRLADFMVPKKILFMDGIPKGSTGKLNSIGGLAQEFGLEQAVSIISPTNDAFKHRHRAAGPWFGLA